MCHRLCAFSVPNYDSICSMHGSQSTQSYIGEYVIRASWWSTQMGKLSMFSKGVYEYYRRNSYLVSMDLLSRMDHSKRCSVQITQNICTCHMRVAPQQVVSSEPVTVKLALENRELEVTDSTKGPSEYLGSLGTSSAYLFKNFSVHNIMGAMFICRGIIFNEDRDVIHENAMYN